MKHRFVKAIAAALFGGGMCMAQGPAAAPPPGPAPAPLPGQASPAYPAPAYSPGGPNFNTAPGCGAGGCGAGYSACDCGDRHNLGYINFDYLLWSINHGHLPSLNNFPAIGVLSVDQVDFFETPDGTSLGSTVRSTGFFPVQVSNAPTLANQNLNVGDHSGGRITAGLWADTEHCWGAEVGAFWLQRRTAQLNNQFDNDSGQFVFNTPFTNQVFTVTPATANTAETRTLTRTEPIFFVRQVNSSVFATYSNQMWGAEVNARCTGLRIGCLNFGGLVGFRYLDYKEDLEAFNRFNFFQPADPAQADPPGSNLPDRIDILAHDHAQIRNQFYGAQVGFDIEGNWNWIFASARGKLAVGAMHQSVDIFANTTTTAFAPDSQNVSGGATLFGANDVGHHGRNQVSAIPELNLRVGVQPCCWFRAYVGYDAMYIANVARVGDISTPTPSTTTVTAGGTTTTLNVNGNGFRFSDSNIWTQGFSAGIELSY